MSASEGTGNFDFLGGIGDSHSVVDPNGTTNPYYILNNQYSASFGPVQGPGSAEVEAGNTSVQSSLSEQSGLGFTALLASSRYEPGRTTPPTRVRELYNNS